MDVGRSDVVDDRLEEVEEVDALLLVETDVELERLELFKAVVELERTEVFEADVEVERTEVFDIEVLERLDVELLFNNEVEVVEVEAEAKAVEVVVLLLVLALGSVLGVVEQAVINFEEVVLDAEEVELGTDVLEDALVATATLTAAFIGVAVPAARFVDEKADDVEATTAIDAEETGEP